jgi:hypothetical protein
MTTRVEIGGDARAAYTKAQVRCWFRSANIQGMTFLKSVRIDLGSDIAEIDLARRR